jgi:hypothetical protein
MKANIIMTTVDDQGIIVHFPEEALFFSSPYCPDWLWGAHAFLSDEN